MTYADIPPIKSDTPEASQTSSADPTGPGQTDWAPRPGTGGESHPAIGQLEEMLANLTTYARPVLREIAARAAELAARAAQAAGPAAHKAAEATDQVGGRLATKGREIATDLRRDRDVPKDETGAASAD